MNENDTLDTLSAKQRRFVASLVTAPTIRQAAAAVGISEPTAWRYLREAAVKSEIARRQDALLAQVTAGMVSDMAEARKMLVDTMRNPDTADGVRVRAALGVLDCGLRLLEMLALSDRVADLERRLGNEHQK